MISNPLLLFLILFGLHFALGLVAYVERRLKPLYALLHQLFDSTTRSGPARKRPRRAHGASDTRRAEIHSSLVLIRI